VALTLPWGVTDSDKTNAVDAVRSALSNLPFQASQAEELATVSRTLAPIKRDLQDRATAQQERVRREGQKPSLITFAAFHGSTYLSEKREHGLTDEDGSEIEDEEFAELGREVEIKIRRRLEQQLTGDESQADANRIACEVVDEEVPED
jgi:tRNA splicing endonuclease